MFIWDLKTTKKHTINPEPLINNEPPVFIIITLFSANSQF